MTQQESPGLDLDLHNALVNMSCDMLMAAQSVLRPTPMPGRHHYLFTLKDISKCFQVSQGQVKVLKSSCTGHLISYLKLSNLKNIKRVSKKL